MTSSRNPSGLVLPEQRVVAVDDLSVTFRREGATFDAVRNVSFHVDRGETLAIVGESGSGKSVTSLALMRLVEHGGGAITSGRIAFRRRGGAIVDLAQASGATMRGIRGADIAMIFQEPMTSLNPVFTVGDQISEAIALHQSKSPSEARAETLRLLELVRIPEARRVFARYPHQLSGGMRQRVMIAIALACDPDVLIADEPTTALDVTIQAQILELVRDLRQKLGMAIIWITHDLGVIAGIADRVMVMYGGQVVEQAPVRELFANPRHPYTRALLKTIPSLTGEREARLQVIEGQPPIMTGEPVACPFRTRCAHAFARCHSENPARRPLDLKPVGQGHDVACHWSPEGSP